MVPSFQDVEHAQRELAERGAVFGARVLRFDWLYRAIADRVGYRERVVSDVQRDLLLEASVERARLSVLAESAERPGLRPRRRPAGLRARRRAGRPGALHPGAARAGRGTGRGAPTRTRWPPSTRGYRARARRGGSRRPRAVRLAGARRAAARARPLGRRPGLRLRVRRLHGAGAGRARDAGRALRRARGRVAAVRARPGGLQGHRDRRRRACPSWPRSGSSWRPWTTTTTPASRTALHHVERGLFEADAGEPVDAGGAIAFHSARRRARRGGARRGPACSSCSAAAPRPATWPSSSATRAAYSTLVEQVFGAYGMPYSLDRSVPFAHTGLGRGLLALIRCAGGSGGADDLLAYLRTPGLVRSRSSPTGSRPSCARREPRDAERARAIWEARALAAHGRRPAPRRERRRGLPRRAAGDPGARCSPAPTSAARRC